MSRLTTFRELRHPRDLPHHNFHRNARREKHKLIWHESEKTLRNVIKGYNSSIVSYDLCEERLTHWAVGRVNKILSLHTSITVKHSVTHGDMPPAVRTNSVRSGYRWLNSLGQVRNKLGINKAKELRKNSSSFMMALSEDIEATSSFTQLVRANEHITSYLQIGGADNIYSLPKYNSSQIDSLKFNVGSTQISIRLIHGLTKSSIDPLRITPLHRMVRKYPYPPLMLHGNTKSEQEGLSTSHYSGSRITYEKPNPPKKHDALPEILAVEDSNETPEKKNESPCNYGPIVTNRNIIAYVVKPDQGPTQIANDINSTTTQRKYGYELIRRFNWTEIIRSKENKRYFSHISVENRFNKFNPKYYELNMNKCDIVVIDNEVLGRDAVSYDSSELPPFIRAFRNAIIMEAYENAKSHLEIVSAVTGIEELENRMMLLDTSYPAKEKEANGFGADEDVFRDVTFKIRSYVLDFDVVVNYYKTTRLSRIVRLGDIGPVDDGYTVVTPNGMWITGPYGDMEINLGANRGGHKIRRQAKDPSTIGAVQFTKIQSDHYEKCSARLTGDIVYDQLRLTYPNKPQKTNEVINYFLNVEGYTKTYGHIKL